jgi:nitrogen fixation protein FixH
MRIVAVLLLMGLSCVAGDQPDWKISVEPVGKVRSNYPAQVNIVLQNAKGSPVSEAEVEVVLTMVDMDHGESKTPAKMTKPGVYETKLTFFMVGKWNIAVHARKGAQAKTENFPYDVKE